MSSKQPPFIDPSPLPTTGVLAFDPQKYVAHVEDYDLTDAQKTEFLRTLWDIMATFVRLGFGVESVLPALFQEASANPADGLEQSIPTHEFNVAADSNETKEE